MINYQRLADSITFYESKGFKRIEAPWIVPEYVDLLTKPEGVNSYQLKHNDKCLVASGEQSLLYLIMKGNLPSGAYQTTTACYRNDTVDLLHSKTFMKTELIDTDNVTESRLCEIIDNAREFFVKYLKHVNVVQTDIGYDINYNNVELGSYGIRENDFTKYIYATGLAEPRLSIIIKMFRNELS